MLERGRLLATAEFDYAAVEAEKKEKNSEFKTALDAIGGQIFFLSNAIRNQSEERDVPCLIEDDHHSMEKCVVRTDTGEVIERYPMSESEKQRGLEFKS